MRWIVVALALMKAGFMAFDGMRALFLDDYLTVGGQLGPWAILVSAIGIDPRSLFMKLIFAIYGIAWLGLISMFVRRVEWARTAMLIAAIGTLWYLPIGTLFSIIQIILLKRK